MFSQRLFSCQTERFPLLHPDLTRAHIYTHAHMQFTYRIHHTPTQMHSHILSHTHSYTTLYHMLHTPAHMHTYILIDTHTPHTHPRILYALHTHSGTLTHTHTPHIPYASYTCSCALVHTHRHTHHTHTHTHTTHHTYHLWIRVGPDHQHV